MKPHGRDDGRKDRRLRLQERGAPADAQDRREKPTDVVFDFGDMEHVELRDLSVVLTARLMAGPEERVWARALPFPTWRVLQILGLDHLFRWYPEDSGTLN
ncbi:MAG: hypothetical protein ACE5GJ_09670 [Gemmatimonadota bacterium]